MKKFDIVEFNNGKFAVYSHSFMFRNYYFSSVIGSDCVWNIKDSCFTFCLLSTLEQAKALQQTKKYNFLKIKRNHGQ